MANKLWVGTDSGNEGDYSTAANWSPSGVPVAADNVYLKDSTQDIDGGLDQSAVALASFNVDKSYTGQISPAAGTYLQIAASAVNIGRHDGPGAPVGSGLIKLDQGSSTAAAVNVFDMGTPATSTDPALFLIAAHASTVVTVRKGKVGIAVGVGETTTVAKINVNYLNSILGDAEVYIGSGVTLTTFAMTGGTVLALAGGTTFTVEDGQLTTEGSGAITTLNADGGKVYPNSTGTITALNADGGEVDFTKSPAARTVTTPKIGPGGKIIYDPAIITMTNKIAPIATSGIQTIQAA